MKVYISGKIGNEKIGKATLEKFARRERFLLSKGHEVFNPTRSGLGEMAENYARATGHSFYREILALDIAALNNCDAIYMLPDWQKSPGAMAEFAFAWAIGLEILVETPKGIKLWSRK